MLCNLPEEIRCIASDTVDYPINLRSKVSKMLIKYSNNSSNTAGLEKELVIIKPGCKVMLRRNIDITLGLRSCQWCNWYNKVKLVWLRVRQFTLMMIEFIN